uniref:Uncharacterized protein n=1 Tax=Knipowitschia caucasica TaxID=637954 RepID=A0AAV2IUQ5_KNICA
MCKPRPLRHILQIPAQTCPLLSGLGSVCSFVLFFCYKAQTNESRMSSSRSRVGPEESLSVMQELEDRLKEQIDKLEHLRLSALDLREHVSAVRYH